MLVDSHCHLDFPDFDDDRDSVIAAAAEAGGGHMLTICTHVTKFSQVLAIAEKYDNIFCTVGVHPHNAETEPEVSAEQLIELARHPKVVGFGETGLDFFYEHSPRDVQERFFRAHIEAARETGLPVIVHTRDADEDMARIIGDVPYVNGGIFLPHVLEETYEIDVPDEAFEAIFLFFDRYRWHLDDKPSDDVNEINPDVLGYVFEQLVNSKEMGAYYTKEDVTGYMTSVTLLPAFLDRIAPVAGGPWGLLAEDPDRYIHDSVRHGVDDSLPLEIAESADEPFERPAWDDDVDWSAYDAGRTLHSSLGGRFDRS